MTVVVMDVISNELGASLALQEMHETELGRDSHMTNADQQEVQSILSRLSNPLMR